MKEQKGTEKTLFIVFKTALFLFIAVLIFGKVQNILTPIWNDSGHRSIIGCEMLDLDQLDALFLGTSHIQYGVSPLELYENYGILSFSMVSGGQPVEGSYFLLKKAYETHEIENVFFDVSGLFRDEHSYDGENQNAQWRLILDNLKISPLKYEVAQAYAAQDWSDGFAAAMIPMIKYHSRWAEITRSDFYSPRPEYYYSMGQTMLNAANPSSMTLESLEELTKVLSEYHSGTLKEVEGGMESSEVIDEDLYAPYISERNLEYFLKIKQLCEEHGSRLILCKIPVMQPPQAYEFSWTPIKSEMMKELAERYQVPFLDLLYDVDSLVDFRTDTVDSGTHLNIFGAQKVSDYLGNYIIDQKLAVAKKNDIYDWALEKYQKIYTVAKLGVTADFSDYMTMLKEQGGNWTIVIAARHDYVIGMTEEDYRLLENLGLNLIADGNAYDAYVGIVSRGETLYEAVSDYEIRKTITALDAHIEVRSTSAWVRSPYASIRINGQEYSLSQWGLNFVVFDHETGCVIDSAIFDPAYGRTCGHKNGFLSRYESELCLGGW